MRTPSESPSETPARRYPKRLKAGSPLPPPLPPPVQSDRKKRRVSKSEPVPSSPQTPAEKTRVFKTEPVPGSPQTPAEKTRVFKIEPVPGSPQTPAVQSNGAESCSLPTADLCGRTDPVAACCLVSGLPPPSSSLKDVPSSSLGDLFAVYSYLRCFSRLLFLSPFSLEKFVTALCAENGDALLDSVHFSLLEAVKRHALSTESSSFFG